jgi:hypothetical protein
MVSDNYHIIILVPIEKFYGNAFYWFYELHCYLVGYDAVYSVEVYPYFREIFCIHCQGLRISRASQTQDCKEAQREPVGALKRVIFAKLGRWMKV